MQVTLSQGRINPIDGPGPAKIWGPPQYIISEEKNPQDPKFKHYDRVDEGRDKYVT